RERGCSRVVAGDPTGDFPDEAIEEDFGFDEAAAIETPGAQTALNGLAQGDVLVLDRVDEIDVLAHLLFGRCRLEIEVVDGEREIASGADEAVRVEVPRAWIDVGHEGRPDDEVPEISPLGGQIGDAGRVRRDGRRSGAAAEVPEDITVQLPGVSVEVDQLGEA